MSGTNGNAGILVRDRRNGQWAWVNNAVLADPHLTAAEKVVYSALATFGGCEVIKPSIPTIAERSSLGVRTVRMALGKLKQVSYISVEVQKNGSGPSVYSLLKAANGCSLCRAPRQNLHPGKICTPAKSAGDPGKKVLQTPAKSAAEIDNELDKRKITPSAVPQNRRFKLEPPSSNGRKNGHSGNADYEAIAWALVPCYLEAANRKRYDIEADSEIKSKLTRLAVIAGSAREIHERIVLREAPDLDHTASLKNTLSAMKHVVTVFFRDKWRATDGRKFNGMEYAFRDFGRVESALEEAV